MKSVIIYYSYSGNTRQVAGFLSEYLKQISQVEIKEVKAKESNKFLIQALRALRKIKAPLPPINFDLSRYDIICVGTPVWAFGPAPAVNTFLENCFGLENKRIILFCTYGSGLGKERCLNYMQNV
ncbi:MAG: hypothetical protein NC909_01065, partial [Candidatus Omnitrophica bacterium]|nr:hypothetical protein [Candidatus Omnitrophota bacterium]